MPEKLETTESSEWQNRLEWFHPAEIIVDGDELHWSKISREDVLRSFDALARIRPFLEATKLTDDGERLNCRDRLSRLTGSNQEPLFDERDLRFFDLYFGTDRINIERVGTNDFDVTNGRHRLWLARQAGIKELPVLLSEKTSETKGNYQMSRYELSEIEEQSEAQHAEAEEMKTDIERHKERAQELEAALQKIRAAGAEIGSDKLREVEQRTENAKAETERQLEEIRRRRDELLDENRSLTEKIIEQNTRRSQIHSQVGRIKMMFEGASDEFKSEINEAGDALSEELENLSDLQADLLETRQKLEQLDA